MRNWWLWSSRRCRSGGPCRQQSTERHSARGGRGDGKAASSKSSYSGVGRRLEISTMMVMSRARMNLSRTERGRGRQSYQAIWIVEATLVASLASSRKSRCPEISHQSSSCGQQDPTADETVVLVHKKLRNRTREVR
jgi:hypothetical protein